MDDEVFFQLITEEVVIHTTSFVLGNKRARHGFSSRALSYYQINWTMTNEMFRLEEHVELQMIFLIVHGLRLFARQFSRGIFCIFQQPHL